MSGGPLPADPARKPVPGPRVTFRPTPPPAPSRPVRPAVLAASTFRSVVDLWNHRVGSTPDAEAMTWRGPDGWTSLTWREADKRVQRIANGLLHFGLTREDRCGLLCSTRVEWILADLGILAAGGATTTVYPSGSADDAAYVLSHSGAVIVFVEDEAQVHKLRSVRDRLPELKRVVVFDPSAPPDPDGWVVSLAVFERDGTAYAAENPSSLGERSKSVQPDSLATLIYTSGTTGDPKGVMLTHDAWVYEAEALDALGVVSPADRQYLFLPLAHVFAKVLQVAFIRLGIPTVVDGSSDDLIDNLAEQQPTWMGGVPRVFEKAYARVVQEAESSGAARAKVFHWALGIGREVSRLRQQGREPTGVLRLKYRLADRLVFSKVKAMFGGRLRFFISGGAPLSKEIAEFFHACDLLVLEGYGLTESAAASCVNPPDAYRFGTVGPPLPGCEIRIAEDGEILLRSRGVMRGYYRDPEATAEALTPDGWLRTGDIGRILDTGHLEITDRKKEIVITAGGKNLAPARFQNLLKARCALVGEVLVHGDRRAFCSALIALDPDSSSHWARSHGLDGASIAQLAGNADVRAEIQACIDQVNRELAGHEGVRRFAVLPEYPTEQNGMLTPSLKVKRRVVESRYQALLDGFYADPSEEHSG
jgi:long-chain acyl-CoA synthetase